MTNPTSSVNGLSSGIQWQGLIDQIMAAEQAQMLTPVTARQAALNKQATAWTTLQGIVGKVNSTAAALRDPTAFNVLAASATTSSTTGRALVSATATTSASAGTYGIEVLAVASAEKLAGAFMGDSSSALGVSGTFALNGVAVTVAAGDSLAAVRDRINAANTGTAASGVSATIAATSAGSHLLLRSDVTGAAGIDLVDGTTGTLQALGFIDGTSTANITASGATQTFRMPSGNIAIGASLGTAMPTASTITVGGVVVSIDLATDSLATIASRINTATGNATSASVKAETVAGRTTYRLVTDATVATDASVNLADSARALAVLGFMVPGRSGVTQQLKSANTFVDGGTGLGATGTALLTALQTNGQPLGIAASDTVTVSGTRGDGSTFTGTLAVSAGTTLQDLTDAITAAGAGSRAATASLSGGQLVLTDGAAGDSRLALSVTVTTPGGATTSLGTISTANGGTTGLSRQVATGTDAQFRVDGQLQVRATNSVTDAIAGVTLNLLGSEPNTTVTLTLVPDANVIVQKVQDFVSAYNAAKSFVTTYTADGGTFAHSASLKSMSASLTNALLGTVTGLTGSFATAAVTGLQHDKAGVLSLDVARFAGLLQTNFADVRKIFSLSGTPSDSDVTFVSAGTAAKASATPYAVVITQAATQATVTGSVWTTYATAGAPDTMSVTDASTGRIGSITIANGDTIAATVQKLNSLFAANLMSLSATVTVTGALSITGAGYGTGSGFSVAYTPGAGGDGTASLGIAAQSYAGVDVAGSINGVAATGIGQTLTGATGDASAGIVLRYAGAAARTAGTIALSIGAGGALAAVAAGISDPLTGAATTDAAIATQSATDLNDRILAIKGRLAARRAALTAQYLAMETALSKIQSVGSALTSAINALQANKA
ncbi:MAG: flagellar filament capping protein FliD [Gemmatimonadaceae bacterium]